MLLETRITRSSAKACGAMDGLTARSQCGVVAELTQQPANCQRASGEYSPDFSGDGRLLALHQRLKISAQEVVHRPAGVIVVPLLHCRLRVLETLKV
jgi:hypothetical protein